jgi:hypothetical protein
MNQTRGLFKYLIGLLMLIAIGIVHAADANVGNANTTPDVPAAPLPPNNPVPDPAEATYQKNKADLEAAIQKKSAELQAIQQKIAQTIYPAAKPPLLAQEAALKQQLQDLILSKQTLEALNHEKGK